MTRLTIYNTATDSHICIFLNDKWKICKIPTNIDNSLFILSEHLIENRDWKMPAMIAIFPFI